LDSWVSDDRSGMAAQCPKKSQSGDESPHSKGPRTAASSPATATPTIRLTPSQRHPPAGI
jgi:hypothetical protein